MGERAFGWTQSEASISAAQINRYWAERGYRAEAIVVKTYNGENGSYTVRSNCINGVPTRKL